LSILAASEVVAIPYDDFSEPYINKDRWKQAEFVREVDVSNHRLLSKLGTPNPVTIDAYPYKSTNDLVFFDPQSIHAVQADVIVFEKNVTSNGAVKAIVGGRWYHYNESGQGGYIGGEIAVRGDAIGLKGTWSVVKLGPYYSVLEVLGTGEFTTTINTGTPNTLYIGYDENANQFIFKVGTEEQTFGPTGLPDGDGIGIDAWKYLLTQVEAVDSASSGYISAAFSNVYVNGLPYEDFSSVLLDPTRWWISSSTINSDEFVREISGGSFRSKIRTRSPYTFGLSNSLEFVNPSSIGLISTKITPMQYYNEDNTRARVEAHIAGHFYNEGTSNVGHAGEVEAKIWIGGNWNGGGAIATAHWLVGKWQDSQGSFFMILDQGTFAMPIILGSSYVMSLGWNGNQLIFKIADVATGVFEESTYVPLTAINRPNIPWKEIGTFVYNTAPLEATIEAFFDDVTIEPAIAVSVVSPNGGETWPAGATKTIRWSYTGNPGAYIKIELLKGGIVNRVIRSLASKGTGGTGSCNWTIPANQPSGVDYRIRVTSTNGAYTGTSGSDFTIAAPTLTVVSPNGGETLTAGSMQTIRWSYNGNPGAYVKIELLKGGVVNRTIGASGKGSGGSGSRNWTIPANQAPGADYRIRVTSTTYGGCTYTSDSDFTIATPTVTVVSPNGGETLTAGTTQTIGWSYTGNPGLYVKIELLKGGVVNRTIASFASKGSGGIGSRSWKIPLNQAPGPDYRIRVTSMSNHSYSDISDTNFTISR
jgi:hypothetical protein